MLTSMSGDKHVLTTSISLGLASSNFSNDVSPELAKASDIVGPRMYKHMFHRIIIVYGCFSEKITYCQL